MPAIIHCVRHAQGYHNLGVEFHHIQDPQLTTLGKEQCVGAREAKWQDQSRISLVTASPLSRTLNTALLMFESALSDGSKIHAIPDAQEISDLPCDTGSDPNALQTLCAESGWPVDLSLVADGWNVKSPGTRYAPETSAIKERARRTRQWLREKALELEAAGIPNPEIVLVTHGGYLHYFTDDWEAANKFLGTGWANCESRSYSFDNDCDNASARLVETLDSRRQRGLSHPMYSVQEQDKLFEKALQYWRDQGLIVPPTVVHPEAGGIDNKNEVEVVA